MKDHAFIHKHKNYTTIFKRPNLNYNAQQHNNKLKKIMKSFNKVT